MRILLIRHGRSAHVHRGGLLDRTGVERWLAAYDAAGIADDDPPPPSLIDEIAGVSTVAASDLARAIASAARLAPGREVTTSPLFREHPLTIPSLPFPVPFAVWSVLVHARWGIDIMRGHDEPSETRERSGRAAVWCREAAGRAGDGTVAVVTHGAFRRLLARRMIAEGWRAEHPTRDYGHWSVWRLRAG
ncbi:MAG TPA: histidine phosphatase family protein [Candidatus Eisenbacteria bacterium]|nr:histidine phosphatase family protein [Candidatus Eisenbacteria bacterium]